MQQIVDAATPVITFLLLVAVGIDLTVADFRRVRQRPGMVAAGVLVPPLLLPPLALLLNHLVDPPQAMAEALLLLAVCPIGGLSNVYSLLARASTALSVTLTTVSCAAALVTIPAASVWLDAVWHHPAVYVAPLPILLRQLLVVLVPPVLLGMAIRWAWPVVAARCRGVVQSAGFGLLFVLLALIIASGGGADLRFGAAATLVLAFLASASPVGWVIGWLLGGSRADRFTFAAEFSTRNVAIALGLALTLHNHRALVWFGAVYLIFEIPLLGLAALAHRRGVAA